MQHFDDHIFSFFENDKFIQWAISDDEDLNLYWEQWLKKNPNQRESLLKAKKIAQDLYKSQRPEKPTENLANDIWQDISAQISSQLYTRPTVHINSKKRFYWVAASVIGLLLISSLFFFRSDRNKIETDISQQKISNIIIKDSLTHSNISTENHVVYLVDGSKVTLRPGSSIKHVVFLQKDKREIFLDGDAFFEVAKDPQRPFYVYAHDIVLRVLGTSFNVRTDKGNGNITVLVRTGKVSVYKKNSLSQPEYVLTPNEGVHYTAHTQSIEKTKVDNDFIKANSKPQAQSVNFDFEEMPVSKIFGLLEEAYGIKINFDEKIFSQCAINTSLNDEPFDEKMKIICEAINANYKIENNEVIVEGKACK